MQTIRHRLKLATVLGLTASLVLVACGGGGDTAEADETAEANEESPDEAGSDEGSEEDGSDEGSDEELIVVDVIDTNPGTKVRIAQEEGFFEKHGLEVNLETLSNGAAVLAALQGGSAAIGYADLYSGINAHANNLPLRFVVANNHNTRSIPWLYKADSGIESPKDFEGRTIGVAPVPQHTVNLRGYLRANDVDVEKVEITTIDTAQVSQEILQSGAVDVVQGTWPVAYGNEGNEGQYDFAYSGVLETSEWAQEGATTAGFWSTLEWVEANEDTAQRFADAWREYNAWLLDLSREERAALLEEHQGLDVEGLTGGDPDKIDRLIGWTEQEVGFDFEATQQWYELGLEYAGDRIEAGVDLRDVVWKSAITD